LGIIGSLQDAEALKLLMGMEPDVWQAADDGCAAQRTAHHKIVA